MAKDLQKNSKNLVETQDIETRLIVLRGQKVLIDRDVAELYGVETKRVNEAVKNNPDKFPDGYFFTLQGAEKQQLVENFDHFKTLKNSPVEPRAFTEKGLYMLATILKSERATAVTIAIIETFAKVRELKRELVELHKETDKTLQEKKMHHFGEVLTDIVMPDLETSETESSLEINFLIGKIKHTVKRVRKSDNK
ncbi:MAG: ORF6N domain-containing protein [Bacteroidales bacterium]|nr:ORF6N domain-containing protein [Bacteroidales bacterium]